jgi:hypothetical protein
MRISRIALPLVLVASACGAQIADGADTNGHLLDAGGATPIDAAPGSPPIDAPPTSTTCTARVLYLNFDGQQLTRGAPSDATQNIASWMNGTTGTAPRYHDGDSGRDIEIQTITDGVRTLLAGFPVTVVTTRPASGQYVMIVLGGAAGDVRSRFTDATTSLDCGDTAPNDVAWISDQVAPLQHVINDAIGAVGFGLGLTATTDPNDCLCGWANDCQSTTTTACTLGAPIARDPQAGQLCPDAGATQNEVTTIHDAFCGKSAMP